MTNEKLTPERAVRLLRAKGAELEHFAGAAPYAERAPSVFAADIALIAQLLADHIETGRETATTVTHGMTGTYSTPGWSKGASVHAIQFVMASDGKQCIEFVEVDPANVRVFYKGGTYHLVADEPSENQPGANDINIPATHKMPSRGFETGGQPWGPDHPDYDEMGQ